jgi:hypothetical protein
MFLFTLHAAFCLTLLTEAQRLGGDGPDGFPPDYPSAVLELNWPPSEDATSTVYAPSGSFSTFDWGGAEVAGPVVQNVC